MIVRGKRVSVKQVMGCHVTTRTRQESSDEVVDDWGSETERERELASVCRWHLLSTQQSMESNFLSISDRVLFIFATCDAVELHLVFVTKSRYGNFRHSFRLRAVCWRGGQGGLVITSLWRFVPPPASPIHRLSPSPFCVINDAFTDLPLLLALNYSCFTDMFAIIIPEYT